MNNLSIFNYQNMGTVRVVIGEQGEPWFCLSDVCDILEIINSRDVIKRLESGCVDTIYTSTTSSNQYGAIFEKGVPLTFVNEPGLYEVIFLSRKPEAKEFRKWVFEEVLPMIRQTGMFISDNLYENMINNPELYGNMLIEYGRLKKERELLRVKEEGYDNMLNAEGTLSVGATAKLLNLKNPDGKSLGRNGLFDVLRQENILMTGNEHGKDHNLPFQQHVSNGYFEVIGLVKNNTLYAQTRITPRGIEMIRQLLNFKGYYMSDRDISESLVFENPLRLEILQ